MIGSSSARIKERLTDGEVIVVEVSRKPLLAKRHQGELDTSLREEVWRSSFCQGPSSSAVVRGLVIHDIKEIEGVRQQEEQEDKTDEVNGEVEEVTHRAHET